MNHMPVYFWVFCVPSEIQEPLYKQHVEILIYGHSGSPVSFGSHYISLSFTSNDSQAAWVPSEW